MNTILDLISNCKFISWAVGGLIGIFCLIILSGQMDLHWLLAFIIAVLIGIAAGYFLAQYFCTAEDTSSISTSTKTVATAPVGPTDVVTPAEPTDDEDTSGADHTAADDEAPDTGNLGTIDNADAAPVDEVEVPQPPTAMPAPVASSEAATPEAPVSMKPTLLAGEQELATRKGEWRYEGRKPEAAVATEIATESPTADVSAAEQIPDYDNDGILEGTDEGTRPNTLSAAREGGADNLKEIKGVGPKMEAMLNEMGFYHFDQIAAWTSNEVAWVDANLKGFRGRVSRDNWVEQAKILASGGETEFSKRVDDGSVY